MNFVHLYESAAETNVKLKPISDKLGKSKRKKMKSNLLTSNTQEEINENNTNENQPLNHISNKNARNKYKVKSAQVNSHSETDTNAEIAEIKPKKRNKSVSFMLDDKEEVAVKKTKSEITASQKPNINNNENKLRKQKKNKKTLDLLEIDNTNLINNGDVTSVTVGNTKKLKRNISEKLKDEDTDHIKEKKNKKTKKDRRAKESGDSNIENVNAVDKTAQTNENKKKKKQRKEIETDVGTSDQEPSVDVRKSKKKKHLTKAQNEIESGSFTSDKNENKPEVIAGDLESLSIGDNTHTLSNLLDEMTVVDKKKQKKNRTKQMKGKQPAAETTALEVEGKKEKGQKKRWHKGRNPMDGPIIALPSVYIANLPISIILSYKKLLTEHFAKCGTVRRVGIAQIYPSESTKPVFNTTVSFDTTAEATKALEEDNTTFEGTVIRVTRPYHRTETTAVIRTYGTLSEQIISTIFSNVGCIRRIKQLVKGKKSMATAFVELDEPEAVERAIKMAEEVRIGGKRIHVCKFQVHEKPQKDKKHKATDKVDEKKPAIHDDEDSDDLNN